LHELVDAPQARETVLGRERCLQLGRHAARRKKSLRGLREPRTGRIASASCDCDSRVENAKFELPPSGFMPAATAIVSSSVDLPLPFSPTR